MQTRTRSHTLDSEFPVSAAHIVFSNDESMLYTGDSDGAITVWSNWSTPGASYTRIGAHQGQVSSIAIQPGGTYLVTGGRDNEIHIWNASVAPLNRVAVLPGHESTVSSLAFSSDGNWLASSSHDNSVQVWNVQNWTHDPILLQKHGFWVYDTVFSPGDQRLVSAGGYGNLFEWEMNLDCFCSTYLRGDKRQSIDSARMGDVWCGRHFIRRFNRCM